MNQREAKKLRQLERRRISSTLTVWFRQPFRTRLWVAWKLVTKR
jgi:hypothetical protein